MAGERYVVGRGVAENDAEAFKRFDEACTAGEQSGCGWLGTMYYLGIATQTNIPKAKALLTGSCAADVSLACKYLGDLAQAGAPGFPPDPAAARVAHDKACKLGRKDTCPGAKSK